MWYVFKSVFFMLMCFAFILLGAFHYIPFYLSIICSVGCFACFGLTIAQMFCEDL
jgi:hypothetical protein